jgi:hypothetical protein
LRYLATRMFLAATVLFGSVGPLRGDVVISPGSTPDSFERVFAGVAATAQISFSGSVLGSLPVGTEITGIAFRAYPEFNSFPTPALSYSSYSVEIGPSVFAAGSLSSTFADNIGAGTVLARSGPLSFAAGAFPAVFSPDPSNFGPEISFTTNYTYTGGVLLLTLVYSAPAGGAIAVAGTDGPASTMSWLAADGSSNPTADTNDPGAAPDVLFFTSVASVPEPTTLVLAATAIPLGLAYRWRRRRRTA